jgi:hypothetical protein
VRGKIEGKGRVVEERGTIAFEDIETFERFQASHNE